MPISLFRPLSGLLVLALLAACNAPMPERGFRDPGAPFASTQRFDVTRFLGEWVQVAAFAAPGQGVAPERHLYRRATTGQLVAYITGADGATRREVHDLVAPGRLRPRGQDAAPGDLWVLWVDEGFRTAVLGTPSGSRAFILDRSATPALDRLRAAREILDWYGYDMALLQTAR
jgi:apolipoprotein D and lipocalin family protein